MYDEMVRGLAEAKEGKPVETLHMVAHAKIDGSSTAYMLYIVNQESPYVLRLTKEQTPFVFQPEEEFLIDMFPELHKYTESDEEE